MKSQTKGRKILKKLLFATTPSWAPFPLRMALGLMFMAHGGQKLFGWFGGYGLSATAGFFAEKLGMTPGIFWATLAGCGEFFGGFWFSYGF